MNKNIPIEVYHIDKIDVIRSQLETAIELLFLDRHPIPICNLVYSAWSVAKDILIQKNLTSSREYINNIFPEEKTKETMRNLEKVWNFSKHAKNDPHCCLQFPADWAETSLAFAIHDFAFLAEETIVMQIYIDWFTKKNVSIYNELPVFGEYSFEFNDLHLLNSAQQKNLGHQVFHKYCEIV